MDFIFGIFGIVDAGRGDGLGAFLAVWQQRAGRLKGVGRKGLSDGLCSIQSGPTRPCPLHCTAAVAWILQVSGAEVFALFTL